MTNVEILASVVTPIVAVLFALAVARYGIWDVNRSRRARLNAQIKQG